MIYLDNAAGTRIYPEVIDVMSDVMKNNWGNPSADYSFGHDSLKIIENVREQIAADINCSPEEIIFTSGACEANSLALQGVCNGDHRALTLFTTKLEHTSIMENKEVAAAYLMKNERNGYVKISEFLSMLREYRAYCKRGKIFVSIAAANGEIGVIQSIPMLSDITHQYNGIFHTDATQLFPEQRIDVTKHDIDLMSVSAQKFHGPRGIGFLYVRNGIDINPIIHGSQEKSLRGGTYNVAAIAGMGKALELTRNRDTNQYVKDLRDKLLNNILNIPGVQLNGPGCSNSIRLINNISITVDGVSADQLVAMCDTHGIMVAKGSACQSYNPVPSKTLLAIGLTEEQALSTIRITLDEFNTKQEVEYVSEMLPKIIARLRQIA